MAVQKPCKRCGKVRPFYVRCQCLPLRAKPGEPGWFCEKCGRTEYKNKQCTYCKRLSEREKNGNQKPDGESGVGNQCEICKVILVSGSKSPESATRDHNHFTGNPRGWLCNRCNKSIGGFSEDIIRLQSAIEYLRKYQ